MHGVKSQTRILALKSKLFSIRLTTKCTSFIVYHILSFQFSFSTLCLRNIELHIDTFSDRIYIYRKIAILEVCTIVI